MKADLLGAIFSKLDTDFIVEAGRTRSFYELKERTLQCIEQLSQLPKGSVVCFDPHFDFNTIALTLALYEKSCVLVPLPPEEDRVSLVGRIKIEYQIYISNDNGNQILFQPTGERATHNLIQVLRDAAEPGLVVLTSGSTGHPKAALHNFKRIAEPYLEKLEKGRSNRILAFHSFHRIAGISMLLHSLTSHSLLVVASEPSPGVVAKAIEQYAIDVFPTSPSFLSLMLVSGVFDRFNLSSLKLVNFGSEPSSEQLIGALKEKLPGARLRQVYGTSELGLLKTKSHTADALFFKSDDPDVQLRIRSGRLEIKSRRQLLGYLFPEQALPITDDGWFETGDLAIEVGDEIRVLGRSSDAIKVAGHLVYPIEIEGVIQELPGVVAASVHGEENFLLGEMVVANVSVIESSDGLDWRDKILSHCRGRLPSHKVPQKLNIIPRVEFVGEFKKKRGQSNKS